MRAQLSLASRFLRQATVFCALSRFIVYLLFACIIGTRRAFMMVKRCCYGLCNTDNRYPERIEGGISFIPFPKPARNLEKCLRWIKLCGRPHSQLNTANFNRHTFICSKHFVNIMGPTEDYPDPLPADRYTRQKKTPARKGRTIITDMDAPHVQHPGTSEPEVVQMECGNRSTSSACQTSSNWVEPMDLLFLTMENEQLKRDLSRTTLAEVDLKRRLQETEREVNSITKKKTVMFTYQNISEDESLLVYYVGFSRASFDGIFNFLVPNGNQVPLPLSYVGKGKLSQISKLLLIDQLLLTMCKLRNNFDLKDLAHRFGISQQAASVIFNSWVNYMFLRFGEVSFWPHHDEISKHMPEDYKKDFPTTFAILDCTEIKIQKPSSLKAQSQTYSDYKSTNTLKALVAVDPRGSVLFSSMLFSGSMSDKQIFVKSGMQATLKKLVEIGYLKVGDAIMGDKGFDIEKEVNETGLQLNIPPFARSGQQMLEQDVVLTKKIAKHRVHVERSIRRIKSFKILSGRINLSMMSSVDQIWFICSFLTAFMPPCIKY